MVQQLVPKFILEQMRQGVATGSFRAVSIFVDVSSFTPMATALMEYSTEGAEVIAAVLDTIFAPLIDIIYAHGGFVATFAGDAFTALFPFGATARTSDYAAYLHAVVAAWQCNQFVIANQSQRTRFGQFSFAVRLSIADGLVEWGIWQSAGNDDENQWLQHATYFFMGEALDRCFIADKLVPPGEVVLTKAVYQRLPPAAIKTKQLEDYYQLMGLDTAPITPMVDDSTPLSEENRKMLNRFFPNELLGRASSGEFRQIVAVFINLAECPRGPESLSFQHQLFHHLAQYGGYLCSVGRIGRHDSACSLILFWGAPTSHENDVMRALRFVTELKKFSPTPIRTGITFHLGYAGFIGSKKRAEYTCYSVHVALAARQMTSAQWDEILLDEQTAAYTRPEFHLQLHSQQQFKGFSTALPVYRLGRRRDRPDETAARIPLIGRDREFAELRAAIEPILQGRFGGVVFIMGEVGIGKSRLLREFQRALHDEFQEPQRNEAPPQTNRPGARQPQLDASPSGQSGPTQYTKVSWLYCRTGEILRQSLNPFRYLFYHYFEQSSTHDRKTNEAKFAVKFNELLAAINDSALQNELKRQRSILLAFVGLPWNESATLLDDFAEQPEDLTTAFRAVLLAESLRHPVILQIEDAHLLDRDSLHFVELLLRNAKAYPLLLLMSIRTNHSASEVGGELDSLFLSEAEPRKVINLQPLSKYNLRLLAIHYLKMTLTPSLLNLLDERAKGNPFFAEQMLIYWREQDLLLWGDQGLTLKTHEQSPFAERFFSVSPDLWSLLIARLDSLPVAVKQVVQIAAVLGYEFDGALLRIVLLQEKLSPDHITLAEKVGIWQRRDTVSYRFHHALLCDTAYGMQSRSQLKQLHHRAAKAIEELYQHHLQPYYARLVHHYEKAEVIEPQQRYAKLAGQYAASVFLNQEALHYFSRAKQLTAKDNFTEQYELSVVSEELHKWLGNRTEREAEIQIQLHLAQKTNNQQWLLEALLRHADLLRILGDYDEALTTCFEATDLATALDDAHHKAQANYTIGRILRHRGDHPTAHAYLTQAIEEAQDIANPLVEANCLHELGHLYYVQSAYDQADGCYRAANRLYEQLDNERGQVNCLLMFGNIQYNKGNFSDAEEAFQRALVITQTMGWRPGEASCYTYLGNVYFDIGDCPSAKGYHLHAHRLYKEVGDLEGEAVSLDTLGLIAYREGMPLAAQTYYHSALTIQQALGDPHGEAYTQTHLGHALFAQERWEEAQVSFARALSIRQRLGEQGAAMDSQAGLALVQWQEGNWNLAQNTASAITQWLTENGTDGVEFPVQVYLICYQIFAAIATEQAQSQQQAWEALNAAYNLVMTRAAQINTPQLQQTFVTQIPANAATIALWKQENARRGAHDH